LLKQRDFPYIFITWITKLLTGEQTCKWVAQLKSHHFANSIPSVPSTFDSAKWNIEHTQLLHKTRKKLLSDWTEIFLESQNWFNLGERGKNVATLSGKPDIVAVSGNKGLVIDVKAAKVSDSHVAQVMIYMYALPLALPQFKDVSFDGKVVYQNGQEVFIESSKVDSGFREKLGDLIKELSSEEPAIKTPSFNECQFCPLTSEACPDKVLEDPYSSMPPTGTNDF